MLEEQKELLGCESSLCGGDVVWFGDGGGVGEGHVTNVIRTIPSKLGIYVFSCPMYIPPIRNFFWVLAHLDREFGQGDDRVALDISNKL